MLDSTKISIPLEKCVISNAKILSVKSHFERWMHVMANNRGDIRMQLRFSKYQIANAYTRN